MKSPLDSTLALSTNFWYFITDPQLCWPGQVESANDMLIRHLQAQGIEVENPNQCIQSILENTPFLSPQTLVEAKWRSGKNPRFFWSVPAISTIPLRVTISHLTIQQSDFAFWLLEENQSNPREFWVELMGRLTHQLSSASTARAAADAILFVADQLFQWDACHLNLYPSGTNITLPIVNIDTINGVRMNSPLAPQATPVSPISRQVMEQGPILITRENQQEYPPKRFISYGDTGHVSKSLMFVPIRHSGQNVGVLSFQSYSDSAYSRKELETLQLLADECGAALQRILAQEELTKQARQTELFAELGKKLGNANTPRDAGLVVAKTADEFFGWDSFFINLYNAEQDKVTQILAMDVVEGKQVSLPPAEGHELTPYFKRVLEKGPTLLLRKEDELYGQSEYDKIPFGNTMRRSASLMHVPMVIGNSPVGVLSFQSYDFYYYSERDLEILSALGDHCAGALVRSLAEQNLRDAREKLELRVQLRTQELNSSLQLLRTTLDATTDSIVLVDNFGHAINFNLKWLQLWGLDSDTFRPEVDGILDVIPPFLEAPEDFREHVKFLRINGVKESSRVLKLKDGRIIEAFSSLRELEGKRLGRVWSFRDITERHRAQQELSRRETIYRKAIETSQGVPYTMYYNELGYNFLGEGIVAMTGYTLGEFNKELLHDIKLDSRIVDPEFEGTVDEYNSKMKQGLIDIYRMDIKVRTKSGAHKWINDSSVPIRDASTGAIIGNIGILIDITTRKLREQKDLLRQQRLNQAEKLVALGTLVSGVAHEINNPNNFIKLNIPLLQNAWADALVHLDLAAEHKGNFMLAGIEYSEMREEIPQLLKDVEEGSLRIQNIVHELGNFARGSADDSRQQVNINTILRSSLVLLQNAIKNSTIHFSVNYHEPLPRVLGNPQRLEQVIINLIQNACQALQSRERAIRIWTDWNESKHLVELHIEDEGLGISPEIMTQITDPFFTTKRDTGGTGLGLSISSNIINEHGGSLDFYSEQFKGTHVTVSLPYYQINQRPMDDHKE